MTRLLKHTLLAAVAGAFATGAQAQVVPDGATATTVAPNAAGGVDVKIAPVANSSGISHNTYTDFSVGAGGVNLDNRSVNARTILNEVTSSRLTNLNGPTEVLGPRAHIIIANPNGISVDGATFINSGGVVLSTGKPSIITRQIAPGYTQDNVVLETSGGDINVGPGGLGGAMTSLQILSAKVRIDGPVENSSSNLRSDIRITAGSSSVEYDSAILPISDLEDWGKVTEKDGEDTGLAVEITSRGSLKANSVRIRATSKGAGVSHAGEGLASLGDFVIDAQGKVSTTGSIKAARHVKIKAAAITARSEPARPQQTIEAVNGALTLLATAGNIENTGVLMSGSTRDEADPASKGAVTATAAGNISLLTENADQLAIVFASQGDLVAEAGGNIVNNTGRLLSNAQTLLVAAGDIQNVSDVTGGDGVWVQEETTGKRLWYTFWQSRERTERISVNYGNARVEGQQGYVVGSNVVIKAGGSVLNRGSTINANQGAVEITATNSVENIGSLAGSLEFYRTCGLFCTGYGTSSVETVGGAINAAGDITLNAASVRNENGQIVGYGDYNITAQDVTLTGGTIPAVVQRPPGLYNFWRGSSAWIGTTNTGGLFIAPEGKIEINSFTPVKVNAGVLEARDGVFIPAGQEIVSPAITYPFGRAPIGLFRELTGE